MHKMKLVAAIFVVVLVVLSMLLVCRLGGVGSNGSLTDNEPSNKQLSGVKIASFEAAGWYTGPVFPLIGFQYNLTVRNYENVRMEGLVIVIKTLDNNGTPVDVQFYGNEQPVKFDGILEAKEARTVPGTISSTLTQSMTSLVKTLVVQIKLGNDTLDEFQTNLY